MRDGGRLAERFRGKLKYLGHNLLVGKASNSQVSCRYPFANRGGVALMYYGSFVVGTSLASIQSQLSSVQFDFGGEICWNSAIE